MQLDLVVGPNGAGKSTFVRLVLSPTMPPGLPFVNADVIATQRWPDDPAEHSYEAARIAAATRSALIAARLPFMAETVFSHPSKVEFVHQAQAAGYHVHLHVLLVPVEISLARVERRVMSGGHAVPGVKIRERYERLWPLVASATRTADLTTFYDSSRNPRPTVVARFTSGLSDAEAAWPAWTPSAIVDLTRAWGEPPVGGAD